MSHTQKSFPTRLRGVAIVPIVMTLVILAGVGGAMTELLSTNSMEAPMAKPARDATYASEAGIRLVTSEYNNTPSSSDRTTLLSDIDGKTFVLNGTTNEQFTMNVYSYGYRVTSTDNTSTPKRITAKAINNIPLTDLENPSSSRIAFPVGSKISIQDEIGNDYPVTLAANPGNSNSGASITDGGTGADTITFYVSGDLPPASAGLDFVNIAYDSGGSPAKSGDTVSGLPSGLSNFPPHNGRIGFQGSEKAYTYRTRVVEDNGNVTLQGVEVDGGAFNIADFRNATIVLRKTFAFQSVGSIGTGDSQASKTLVYYDAPTDDPSAIDPDADVEGPTITMENLNDFKSQDLRQGNDRVVRIGSYQSHQGSHVYYAAIHSQRSNVLGEHIVRLDRTEFKTQWVDDDRLSYDIQIKLGSGYLLPFGAYGLCVRYHKQDNGNKYNFYGISLMKYYGGGENSGYNDYIPEDIKPPNMGTEVTNWPYSWVWGGWGQGYIRSYDDTPTWSGEDDKILIVFWRQAGDQRDWIAYKDITDDVGVFPKQWNHDSRIANDNTTLLVRAEEQYIQGIKVNRIKVFYGDGTDTSIARSANTVPYDIVAGELTGYYSANVHDNKRKRYSPSWLPAGANVFPKFPPLTIGDWTSANDYFSFIEYSPGYQVNGSLRPCEWDGINTSFIAANPAADVRILSDGGTIRTREFVTPAHASSQGNSHNFPGSRAEVALHAFGELTHANKAATYDDLAVQFLKYID